MNVVGSFAIGALWAWIEAGNGPSESHRQFVAVGLLGALTTFSTFSLEVVLLMRDGSLGTAALVVAPERRARGGRGAIGDGARRLIW